MGRNRVAVGWEGLKTRKKIAQGKASLRATPWVNSPQNFQALKGRQKIPVLATAVSFPLLSPRSEK